MRTEADADCTWEDREDDLTPLVDAAHPMQTGRHDLYERAVELVGNRYSKAALVRLVNYLLAENDRLSQNTETQ